VEYQKPSPSGERLATVSKQVIPGYETGVMNVDMLEHASTFCLELIKYAENDGKVYDEEELEELKRRLGESNLVKVRKT